MSSPNDFFELLCALRQLTKIVTQLPSWYENIHQSLQVCKEIALHQYSIAYDTIAIKTATTNMGKM